MVKNKLKRYIKRLLLQSGDRVGFIRTRINWGYLDLPTVSLASNFIFQRILRINAATPWSTHFTSCIVKPENIILGENVSRSFALSIGCYFQAINGIEIGADTIFGPGVRIISANHSLVSHNGGWINEEPILIGKDCWLGANTVILPGVQLGDNTIVGAGSVVTKSFPEGNCIIVGNPAKIKKTVDTLANKV